jgi:uncharacterized protein YndB with AHSA1/START domain
MSTDTAVQLTRSFDVAREVLWRMWTDPLEFAAWYGPDGATVDVREMDVRPGGRRVVAMRVETPQGPTTMEFVGEFREVVAPERLVYTEAVASHPETVVEVELREDGDRTTVVLTHHGIPAGSPGETGWTMALDHLRARLDGA